MKIDLTATETGHGRILVDDVEVPHVTGVDIQVRVGELTRATIYTVAMKVQAQVVGDVEVLERCPCCQHEVKP